MRIAVFAAEVATLQANGKPWDGPGGPRLPAAELPAFFALDLNGQLERLVRTGEPPVPPDVYVRIYRGKEMILETHEEKGFEVRWVPDRDDEVEVKPGETLRIVLADRDVMFDDRIGETTVIVPADCPDRRWRIGSFDQARWLQLRVVL